MVTCKHLDCSNDKLADITAYFSVRMYITLESCHEKKYVNFTKLFHGNVIGLNFFFGECGCCSSSIFDFFSGDDDDDDFVGECDRFWLVL